MKAQPFIFMLLLFLPGCIRNKPAPDSSYFGTGYGIKYAQGFEIKPEEGFTVLKVKNPWQQAENVTYEYWLGDTSRKVSKSIPGCFIQVPVEKVVCLSSTFIGFIELLGKEQTITGISGKSYITSNSLLDKVAAGEVQDVGYDENLNYEKLVELQPDVVFLYGITGSVTSIMARLDEMGIKSAVIAEYLEETPLARLEWIKYIAAFFNTTEEAQVKFDIVEKKYNSLAVMAAGATYKPTVLLGLPWSGTWYVSGGKSYMAGFLRDAGSHYLFDDLPYKDSQPVSLEKVFEKSFQADFWLNAGDARIKDDILMVDERFSQIKAFRDDAVYNNNNMVNPSGGNAYYEQGVVEPDIILADIISILHPHLLPSHNRKYYRKLD
ncbi:MAG: ABC transporter substrate-binding protein [Bacteroidales bacterium]|nr:ABC transporter substrate-binding protein [Bacteroidales bacterium]